LHGYEQLSDNGYLFYGTKTINYGDSINPDARKGLFLSRYEFNSIVQMTPLEEFRWDEQQNTDADITDAIELGGGKIAIVGLTQDQYLYTALIQDKYLDVPDVPAPALSLHPNPATDIINITGDMGYNDHVEIYTLEGVCLHRGRGRRIDVSHLARGVYFVRVGAESLRFVKM
jgi:hypothetical protein